jgi:aspartate racemase
MEKQRIGIVGGVGPFAGIDLQQKIAMETAATVDQEHLAVVALSNPAEIVDRTAFLMGDTDENPGHAIAIQLLELERMGAAVAAIPCNTAHAPAIFDVILADLRQAGSQIRLLHMIRETAAYVKQVLPDAGTVGVLSTTGTRRVGLYPSLLGAAGIQVLAPDDGSQETLIQPAIYDESYGIKANGHATPRARADLERAIARLRHRGARAVLLGCTEIPLAFPERSFGGVPLVDPTRVLARALIAAVDEACLRPDPLLTPAH